MAAGGEKVKAFVLITVPANKSGDIVRVETPSIQSLHELVMEKIQDLPNVRVTRTFIIIPSLHEGG